MTLVRFLSNDSHLTRLDADVAIYLCNEYHARRVRRRSRAPQSYLLHFSNVFFRICSFVVELKSIRFEDCSKPGGGKILKETAKLVLKNLST